MSEWMKTQLHLDLAHSLLSKCVMCDIFVTYHDFIGTCLALQSNQVQGKDCVQKLLLLSFLYP